MPRWSNLFRVVRQRSIMKFLLSLCTYLPYIQSHSKNEQWLLPIEQCIYIILSTHTKQTEVQPVCFGRSTNETSVRCKVCACICALCCELLIPSDHVLDVCVFEFVQRINMLPALLSWIFGQKPLAKLSIEMNLKSHFEKNFHDKLNSIEKISMMSWLHS